MAHYRSVYTYYLQQCDASCSTIGIIVWRSSYIIICIQCILVAIPFVSLEPEVGFIHSFLACTTMSRIAPNVNINLQSGRFWATSIASFRERFTDFRSCWVVFIHVVRGRPGGLQFSMGEAVKIYLASDSSLWSMLAVWNCTICLSVE